MKHKENFLGLSLSHHVILVAKFKNFSVRELCPLCFLNDIQLRNHQVIVKVYVEYPFALIFVLKIREKKDQAVVPILLQRNSIGELIIVGRPFMLMDAPVVQLTVYGVPRGEIGGDQSRDAPFKVLIGRVRELVVVPDVAV